MREKLLSYDIFLISLNFKALYLLKKFPIFLSFYQWIVLISTTYIFFYFRLVHPVLVSTTYYQPLLRRKYRSILGLGFWLVVKGRDVKSYGGRKMRDEKGDPLQDPQWGQNRSEVFPAFPGFPAFQLPGWSWGNFCVKLLLKIVWSSQNIWTLPCYSEVSHVYAMGDVSGGKLSLK